ncbi:DNA cytosine methyltransferase [Micromonospora sp. NPDC047620]|uniref:DNA cytosine methyltransferase n=1 Tax=Micromonospora sp. NPDC047620 TaxID=3364251 RepID=UPI00371D1F4B
MILDLYAGAGGWDEGARTLGLNTIGLEIWHDACVTAVQAGHPRIRCDIATYPTAPFTGRVTGLIASPPCQPWSNAGKQLGKLDQPRVHALVDRMAAGDDRWQDMAWEDDRSHHAAQPTRWVRDLMPEWAAFEQVPEVLPLWEHIGRVLRGWGYNVWTGKLCAADYGVPQTRERAVLIASRVRRVHQPTPTHYDPSAGHGLFGTPWLTMAEAVGWHGNDVLQSRRDSPRWVEQHGARENRTAASPAPTITGEAFRWKVRAGQNSQMGDGTQKRYERTTDRPAPTVIGTVSRWKVIAGEHSRPIELNEATVLQGFRPDYPWHGHKTSRYRQLGNAVPPGLAAAVLAVATGRTNALSLAA